MYFDLWEIAVGVIVHHCPLYRGGPLLGGSVIGGSAIT